ncbi:TPA: hypothetical protein KQG29_001404 [Clostridioides difficile]|uniref:hypothetical protein n=1 Tax=Clostridioides sp. ZZV15-6597 TaxID=2811500 RepID=UPI001C190745|nr:hypothetical protein [Clostridioides sp. ZZV15-6597]HBG5344040.1 hypothetical protein [Clostridioides difficile]
MNNSEEKGIVEIELNLKEKFDELSESEKKVVSELIVGIKKLDKDSIEEIVNTIENRILKLRDGNLS